LYFFAQDFKKNANRHKPDLCLDGDETTSIRNLSGRENRVAVGHLADDYTMSIERQLTMSDYTVPDEKTIWLFAEQLKNL